ncbi:MDR family MFS transporter [Microcella daejeonensis]|uniref:MDR family MFS transporter n=1 Tax=Microcella daejeonensis TaxID=2994971 RepID=UPI002270B0C6|nr:MDR family MFS transporter [Microcella daejeonensis]WAB85125.1 MDR family MFS transporter [Microcella daejeonensis]
MTRTDPAAPAAPADAHARRTLLLLFITLMVVMLLASLSQMVLSSALPTLVGELGGAEHLAWVITAYLLASTITMPVYGTISDRVGRKPMLLVAVLLFVVGSVLGGLATDMTTLIIARAVQGLGGGGLMVLSQAAIADVVPARERGKYMGVMGGVFALSSVAGPLLGGFFTEGPGWRWTFWMNVPLGILSIVAIVVLMRLPRPEQSGKARIDALGMALLAVATTGVVLIGTWAGSTYAWASPQIIALALGTIVAGTLFVLVERRAAQPVIPLHLFRSRDFVLATIAALLVSVAMFGAIGYLPTYFQMAAGATATEAGLLMIPMMGALLLTSMITGSVVSRTGRYKLMPVLGTVVLAIGLGLLSTVTVATPVALIGVYIGVIGVGLGTSMQILTLVVQNAFAHREVGTATAAHTFFRQVGGSLGSAVVGSVFAARLASLLAERLPEGADAAGSTSSLTPQLVQSLPEALRVPIVESYNEALIPVFLVMVPIALLAVVVMLFIREVPLATTVERDIPAESLAEGQLQGGRYGSAADRAADAARDADAEPARSTQLIGGGRRLAPGTDPADAPAPR